MSLGPFARERRLDRVERLADRPVAERVEVHLEPERVELRDARPSAAPGRRSEMPRLSVGVAVRVEVRRRAWRP